MQPRLADHEALYGLMLGIALRLQAHPERIERPPYLATVIDAADGCTAALMTPPFGLVLYSDQAVPQAALQQVAQHLSKHGWTLPTVNGVPHLSAAFAHIWSQMQGIGYRVDVEERVFELRKVEPVRYSAGAMRLATMADLDLVVQWIVAFNQEALGETASDPVATLQRVQVRITPTKLSFFGKIANRSRWPASRAQRQRAWALAPSTRRRKGVGAAMLHHWWPRSANSCWLAVANSAPSSPT
jgi:hypothetical protein